MEDADYRALQETVHLLRELRDQPGWKELEAICHDLMAGQKRRVLNGLMESHEEYLKTTHEHVGMHKVFDLPGVYEGMLARERERRVGNDEPLV